MVDIYLAALRLSEYPPLFTSTLVNNKLLIIMNFKYIVWFIKAIIIRRIMPSFLSPRYKYMNFHIYTCIYLYSSPPIPSLLDSSVGRALHQYCRGHGFNILFRLQFHNCLSCVITAMINQSHSVSFFPQVLGNLIFSGSSDGMILFWNLETGECEVAIQGHEGPVHSLDYNNHQHIFSSGG